MINKNNYQQNDPFPNIAPALLNSADIHQYVLETDMVQPFHVRDLKSASYAVRMRGVCKYWDEEQQEHTINLNGKKNGKYFDLPKNTIAFIELEPQLMLPDYIAVRFNLKITNVYRGLLLGTGPLIDPGYHGKIYVPLHNLTNRSYRFKYDEDLVWFEFTKTSVIDQPRVLQRPSDDVSVKYVCFPKEKRNKSLDWYLDKASGGKQIVSGFPEEISGMNKRLKRFRNLGLVSLVTLSLTIIVAVINLLVSTWQTQHTYTTKVHELENLVKGTYLSGVKESVREKKTQIEETRLLREELAVVKKELAVVGKCLKSAKEKSPEADTGCAF